MKDISVADWIQIALLASAIIGAMLGMLNRWAVANNHDRLASYTSAASNTASRINTIVAGLPPGANAAAIKAQLIKDGADALMQEFGTTAPKTVTAVKTEALITAQADKLPNAVLVGDPANSQNVASLVAKLNGGVVVTPVEDITHG